MAAVAMYAHGSLTPYSLIWLPENRTVTDEPTVEVHWKLLSDFALSQLPLQGLQPEENCTCPRPVPRAVSWIVAVDGSVPLTTSARSKVIELPPLEAAFLRL